MTELVIAHLSDLHVDGSQRAADRVRRVMAEVRALRRPADVLVVTGDVADSGDPEQYAQAQALLDLPVPTLLCPGNHDERAAFRAAFGPPAGDGPGNSPVNRAAVVGGVLFAMCDSVRPGRDEGQLEEGTVRWLDEALAADPARPAVVCLHHPPVDVHSPLLDPIRLQDEGVLAAVLDRHPSVVALLCGHAHTAAAATFAGRPVRIAPGVAWTLRLPWEAGPRIDRDAPAALAFHVLAGAGTLTTHLRVAG